MNITKTLFTEFSSSPKKAWFHRNDKKTYTSIVEAEYGAMDGSELWQSIEDQVKLLLWEHIIVTPEGDYDMAFTETKQLLANYPAVIYQPWFQSDDLQVRCDFLVRNESGTYDLREVKAKNTIRKNTKAEPLLDDLLNDISFQKYVLHKTLGSQFSGKCFLVHLNKEYVRQGDIDVKQLIKIQDVTDEALTNEEIEHTLSLMKKQLWLSREEFEKIYPYQGEDHLEYFGTNAPKGSIRYLSGISWAKRKTLYELWKTDILTLWEPERELLLSAKGEPSKSSTYLDLYQTAQSVADIPAIKRELESLEYPLFFYDYETIASPVPLFDGTTPYQAVVIQYSVHKIDQDGTITHREAIIRDKIENNKAIIDQLYDDLEWGKHGTYIVRYKGFENTRNNESALMYPQYKDFFETVNRKTFDLMEIFSKLLYFDRWFKGSASIKKVLPIMTDISYDGLDVPNGSIATGLLLDIAVGKISDTEKEQHIKNLLIYCEQDTRAMVRIWEELHKKIV